jgi:hypothetical protein
MFTLYSFRRLSQGSWRLVATSLDYTCYHVTITTVLFPALSPSLNFLQPLSASLNYGFVSGLMLHNYHSTQFAFGELGFYFNSDK